MVVIAPPPPSIPPNPIFKTLAKGSQIWRIFTPNQYGTHELTFRTYGPIGRFDHHRKDDRGNQQNDPDDRGIYYAAFDLAGCLVEIFGDTGIIEITTQLIAVPTITQDLTLLDLRNSGAMRAGSVAALANTSDRDLSQQWSRYFYDRTETYGSIDGILYFNAHNSAAAVALYSRAKNKLICDKQYVFPLNAQNLRPYLQDAAFANNLIILPPQA